MKKLMTMIAAVATAFGLYAAAVDDSGTSFEGTTGGALSTLIPLPDELTPGLGSWDVGGEATVVSYLDEKINPYSNRSTKFPKDNEYFLKLKTGSEEVIRYAKGSSASASYDVAADGNYYFDSVVQLSAFDEDPSESITGAKLALWLEEIEDDPETATVNEAATNLMIKVGSGDAIVADGDYSSLLGNWARVTIKALPISASQIGFVLFIDTTAVVVDPSKTVDPTLNAVAQAYQKDGVLIVSTATTDAQKISNVGFKGTGLLDDIVFTQTLPFADAKDPETCTVTWPKTGLVDVKIDDVPVTDTEFAAGSKVVVFADPFAPVVVSWTGDATHKNGSYTIERADETEVDIGDYLEDAVATFNGEKCATMAEVIEKVADATGTENTIVILADEVDGFTFANEKDATVTLNLNGKTVMGEEGKNAAIIVDSGTLVITDEATGGTVDGTACTGAEGTEPAAAVQPGDNEYEFTIEAGHFIGAVNGGSNLTGGTYDADPSETSGIADGYKPEKVSEDPELWAIVEDTSVEFTVTAGANSKVAEILVNGDDVTLDPPAKLEAEDTYKVTFEANSGYMFAAGAQTVFEGTAEDEAITVTGPDAVLVVATVTDADGAAMGNYATLTEALTAATNLCTVTLQQDATTDFFKNGPFAADQYPDGLTIDLNKKVWTVDLKSDNKYALQLSSGNKFTFKNGDLKVADNEWATLTTMFQNYADLTVEDVDIDATNLTGANGYWNCAAVFAVMNGNVQITGSTSVTGTDGYLLSVGNHAGEYQSRAVTINTTGALAGDFLFAGGAVTYVNGTLDTEAAYYYGSATNAPSSTTGYPGGATIFAITDLTGFNLTTGVGEVPVAPTTVSTYKRCGQLYADVATAKEAAQTSDDIVLFTDYELAEDETFVNAVAVVAPAQITLGEFALTTPNGDLADAAFVIPEGKKVKKTDNTGSFTYELENAADPIDPTKPAESYATKGEADARVEAINANKATMITVPTDMATVKDSYIANVAAKAVLNGSTDMYDVIVDVIESKDVKDNLAAADATVAAKLGDVAVDDAEVSIAAIPGLYYSALEGATVELGSETARVPATGDSVTIKLDHYEGAGFYQIKVSAAPKAE